MVALGIAGAVLLQMFPGAVTLRVGAGAVDAPRIMAGVRAIVGDGQPRLVGTPAAEAGRARIVELFADAGLLLEPQQIHLQRSRAGAIELTNLVGRVEGTAADRATRGAFALVSHSDSVRVSPGAADAAAGVATIAELVRALRADPPQHDVIVVITDGEEAGLLGADVFMAQHPWAPELTAVVNLDARGACGPAFVFELGPDTRALVEGMARHVAAPRTTSLAAWAYEQMPNSTDFAVFRRAGLTGYNLAFIGDVAAYHTADDTPDRLSMHTLQHYGDTALGLMRALDDRASPASAQITSGTAPAGGTLLALDATKAVWTDIAGLFMVRWPEPMAPLVACVAIVLVLACAYGRAARGADAVRAIGRVVGVLLACIAFAAALGWCARFGADQAGVTMRTAPGRTIALSALVWLAVSVLLAGGVAFLVRTRGGTGAVHGAGHGGASGFGGSGGCGSAAAFAGVWTIWAVVAGASAFLFPAASPLTVLPVALTGVCAVVCVRQSTQAMVVAGSLGGLAGALLAWAPLEPALLDALGMQFAPVTAARAVLVLAPIVPLALLAYDRRAVR